MSSKLIVIINLLFSLQVYAVPEIGINQSASRALPQNSLHNPQAQRRFIDYCTSKGLNEDLCRQITFPNTDSKSTFNKIYGSNTPFVLMPPEDSWDKGIYLLTIAQNLSKYGKICEIRNWYRPEPYNRAVAGARSSKHISGSAIDIEFCTVQEKNNALKAALAMRQKYQTPPGIGVYGEGSQVLHIDLANRIYGPGIANVDYGVSRNTQLWEQVENPTTLKGSKIKTVSDSLSQVNSDFWRNLLRIFN